MVDEEATLVLPIPVYRGLAAAFAAEGVDTQFVLLGDGNMHWVSAMHDAFQPQSGM
jgi:hypothetical protein